VLKSIERVKPVDEIFSNPDEIFWLIGTAYSNTHVHYLIFLSEDGNERRYRISDVYPYFYTKEVDSSSVDILRDYGYEGLMPKVKDVELKEMKNPITGDLEHVFKISAKSPNSITSRFAVKSGLNSIFKDENVFNTKAGFHHQILNETGFIMGMPYTFSGGKPTLYSEGIEEVKVDYQSVFKRMSSEDLPMGQLSMEMIHAVMPDFSKMIAVIDIEIKANMGESMDAELAEVPITSVSITYKDENGSIETIVFVLSDEALENEPTKDPDTFNDDSFITYTFNDERTLLEASISFINSLNHKIILTYNGDSFDIPYISRRLELHNLNLGVKGYKLSDTGFFSRWYKKWEGKYLIDLYEYFANNNIFTGAYISEYENLKLNTIAEAIIGKTKYQYDGRIEDMGMVELAHYNAKDTQLTFELATHDNNFPSFILFFIMRFGNLTLENANRKGVTAWWSGFEYRHLDALSYYHPNNSMLDSAHLYDLKGGSVLPATKGLHYNVDVFDFSSLYPTMVIENNICYSTMNCSHVECVENKLIVQDRETHICTKRRGFIPSALSFLRNARIEIYKPKSEDSRYYAQLSQFVKIFMNACFGAMANPGFAFMSVPAAMTITQTGRDSLYTLTKLIKEENGEVIYGDSIVGSEAVIVKFEEDEPPMILSIQDLWSLSYEKGYNPTHRVDGKEQLVVQGLRVWDGKRWNRVYKLIRHYTIKTIYRTATGKGVVDTTEDHSLVDEEGSEFKPEHISSMGKSPVSAPFLLPSIRLFAIDDIRATILLFLFSMCGTASGTYTGYPSQRTVALHFSSKIKDIANKLWQIAEPAATAIGAKYKKYNTAKGKLVIKFSNHTQLWAFVRRNLYIKGKKFKPLPTALSLPDQYLNTIYEMLKKYYYNYDEIHDQNRWTIKSSSEMVFFTALANHFKEEMTVIPQPKGKIYQIRRMSDMKREVTVSIIRMLPDYVYDMETEDGTFMAGNILCHNTDSVFVIGADEDAHKRISNKMGIEVENEGHWQLMLQYMKKNYILINENKRKIKGLRGKKKDVPKFIRKIFADTIESLNPSMNENEILDLFVNAVIDGKTKLRDGKFEIDDLRRVQTLSKDIHSVDSFGNKCGCGQCYKANTPIVTATQNIMKDLEEAGKDPLFIKSFGRKGVIIEYVKAKDTWKHIVNITKEDIDIDYYEDVFHKVFNQLTEPLGYELVEYLKNKNQQSLNEWFE
jgi:DNA polymerase elongation subunit (family B)